MSHPTWAEVDGLFQQALDLPPADRAAFVERVEAPEVRARLAALLAAADQPTDAFAPSVAAVAADAAAGMPAAIGPYRLLRRLGEGGMGEVFLAERDLGGAVQQVALKRLRPGLTAHAGPGAHARFQQERHVLAGLDHPNVARLLDGGETPDGVSFLAMEFVDGEPITDYCARRGLGRDARLALVVDVARSVEAAHRRLVVHRDLKPSNILVTEDAHGRPVPKLLDFGIAKLLDTPAGTVTLTRTGAQPLTPQYAAPEQLAGGEIVTATDVYGLGVVLYELLTGRRPFDRQQGADLERSVRMRAPARPSTRTGDGPLTLPASALRGDLDTICLKALRTDPGQRYPTAAAFADDIERFLTDRPIEARTATLRYRSALFVRRNRGAVLAGVAVSAALLVGLSTTLWQAREASLERDRATEEAVRSQQSADFLAGLLSLGNPYEGAADVPAQALPDSGMARIVRSEAMDPTLKASLLGTISEVYQAQGRYAEAAGASAQSVRVLREAGAPSRQIGVALTDQAKMLSMLDREPEAEPLIREAYERLRAVPGADAETLAAARVLAYAWMGQDRHDEALALIARELPRGRTLGSGTELHRSFLRLKQAEAHALLHLERRDDAARASLDVLALADETFAEGTMSMQSVRYNMAAVLADAGYLDEAAPLLQSVLALDLETLGPDHIEVAHTELMLADMALLRGMPSEARARAVRAERVYARDLGASHAFTARARFYQSLAAFQLGDRQPAETQLRTLLRSVVDTDLRAAVALAVAYAAEEREPTPSASLRAAEAAVSPEERDELRRQMGLGIARP